jgi:solute carrier family 38 (sodium-coupled neutral amino acid transporter), member 11
MSSFDKLDAPTPAGTPSIEEPVKANGSVKKAAAGDGKSSIAGAVFNLANAVIGAGVGGMPYALKEAGFWSGMFLIVMVACCSDYTLRLIVRLGNRTKRKYYEDLCASQFGHAGYVFVVGAMGIFAYGAAVAYLIGIGDNMAIVVSSWSGTDLKTNPWVKRVTLSAIAIGAVLPLAMLKNMSALSKTSAFSICAVVFIIGVVIKNAITGPGDAPVPVTDEDKELKVIDSNFFPAVGVIAFAFVCHHACFIVYNTLRDNTEARWAKTVHITLSVATSVMFTLAVAAFVTFRGIMKGSFLTNYSYTDPLCNLMRCLFATCQTLTYPIELFVARHSIHALMFPAQKWTQQQHIVITLLLWGSSLAIALNVTDLSIVLELTGGVAAVSIGFLMPGALHAKMTPHLDWRIWRNKGMAKKAAACKEFAVSFFVFVVGVLAMLFTVITMSAHLMHHEGPHDAFEDLGHEEGGHIVPPGPTELGDRL